MNRYVSPIMEMELIDVEDILMSQEQEDDTAEKGENETGGMPLSLRDATNYFN
jgi:hypothetical protein